jgi:hypothetical protein
MQQYVDVPSIVPGMTKEQLEQIAASARGESGLSRDIEYAAFKAALDRQFTGKPVFAKNSELVQKYPKRDNEKDNLRRLAYDELKKRLMRK